MGKSNIEQLNIAKKYLGKGGSRFRKFCGLPAGAAWCDAFVTTIFAEGGNSSLFCSGKKQTYCPTTISICRKQLAEVPPYLALPSDIIFFDWEPNSVPNHIGFVRERKDCEAIYTIEGNTSGGIVANKVRNTKYVCGIYRPHFKATFDASKPLVIDGYFGYHSIAMFQKALGVSVDGILGQGTIKAWQRKIGASPIDGLWGKATSKKAQKFLGVTVDGYFGPASTKALQKWINKVTAGTPSTPVSTGKYIGQACADYDHKAGDSSGKEVCKSKFTYSSSITSPYNWTYVFRPKDASKAEKTASMCEKAIANNNIGYNHKGETAYGKSRAMTKLAKTVNYDLSKITTKCGLSCGDLICLCNHYAGLSTCYIGSGLQLANNLKKNSNFECIKYKKGMTLKRGDTLITAHSNGKNNHVAMVL
jgi:peptidoglycan hydrolase-like protein with peptidoglycan-binding domain